MRAGHEVRLLAPIDPDDRLARALHKGAPPQPLPVPDALVPLGRTVGLRANGAVSNVSLCPSAVAAMRREIRRGGCDVLHIHEPVVPALSWFALRPHADIPTVGTFHTYSSNAITNGCARLLGAERRMNRLHARIAVSEAAAWTARRFFGGRYRVIPNGVHLAAPREVDAACASSARPLRILFIGQAVERKGLPVLLRAFEALREQVPATLTLVGVSREQVAPLMLDEGGVHALGKASEQEKARELERADVLCAPSLGGESFGMVLTEAFAASTPVIASDIVGYRDVVRDGEDGILLPPGDPVALAEALRSFALDGSRRGAMARSARQRAERFAWPQIAAEVLEAYEEAVTVAARRPSGRLMGAKLRLGLAPADLQPRVKAKRLHSIEQTRGRRRALSGRARVRLVAAVVALSLMALAFIGVGPMNVAQSLAGSLSSKPGLILAGFAVMCGAMLVRALAWHSILARAPTWRPARFADALQGTLIGVLMSATLPVRLGETSRALIVARRLGRALETLPVLLATIVLQTLLNLLALSIVGGVALVSVHLSHGEGVLVALALAPGAVLLAATLMPVLSEREGVTVRWARLHRIEAGVRVVLQRLRDGLALLSNRRASALAAMLQLGAWAAQMASCWLVLNALGLQGRAGLGAALAVLFAVNATAFVPLTPANVGVFQAACAAVLTGAYHVSAPSALAYGIVLQAIEIAAAIAMGLPALMKEGISWRELRLRTVHAAPVKLRPLQSGGRQVVGSAQLAVERAAAGTGARRP